MLHIITGLGLGGAEKILASMILHPSLKAFGHSVVSLLDEGYFGETLRSRGIPVYCLNLARKKMRPSSLFRLRQVIQAISPDLVHCWMYHPALMHGLIAKTLPRTPTVWGLHHTTTDRKSVSKRTRGVIRATSIMARAVPDSVVCCSQSAYDYHREMGFPHDKLTVILNGVDTAAFVREHSVGKKMRSILNIDESSFVVGHIGRFDPQKDHSTFIKAAEIVSKHLPDARFVLCGLNVDWNNSALRKDCIQAGIDKVVLPLGNRSDIREILNALDVFVISSSYGEALPVALLEAVSCGVVGIATDVGDCRRVIGDPERVVAVRRPDLLAKAILDIACAPSASLRRIREEGYARVRGIYSIHSMSLQYGQLYERLTKVEPDTDVSTV